MRLAKLPVLAVFFALSAAPALAAGALALAPFGCHATEAGKVATLNVQSGEAAQSWQAGAGAGSSFAGTLHDQGDHAGGTFKPETPATGAPLDLALTVTGVPDLAGSFPATMAVRRLGSDLVESTLFVCTKVQGEGDFDFEDTPACRQCRASQTGRPMACVVICSGW